MTLAARIRALRDAVRARAVGHAKDATSYDGRTRQKLAREARAVEAHLCADELDALLAEPEQRQEPRRFPIIGGPSILWTVLAPHEQQAEKNHGQSLERLAERGGLSPAEAVAVLEDRDWMHRVVLSPEATLARLQELIAEPEQPDWVEQRLRREWWLGHGCSVATLYGDDGEMQCNALTCHRDFKREPLKALENHVEMRRRTLVAEPEQSSQQDDHLLASLIRTAEDRGEISHEASARLFEHFRDLEADRKVAEPEQAPPTESPVMGSGWFVTVGRWDETVVTISERELSGRDLLEGDAALIRGCARHLLSFVGTVPA